MGKYPQPELGSIRLGSDGELLVGKFCAYCGNPNSSYDDYCQHCTAYIADQGPDLTSRLARISRRGSTARVVDAPPENRLLTAQFDRFESMVEALDQSWRAMSEVAASFFAPIDDWFAMLRERYPAAMVVLFGQPTNNIRPRQDTDSAIKPVEGRSPLSARLARIRRYSPSDFDFEQIEPRWSMFTLLFIGWLVGTAAVLAALLLLAHSH